MNVDKNALENLLEILIQAQEFRDFGDTKAYALERKARELVQAMLREGEDAKTT